MTSSSCCNLLPVSSLFEFTCTSVIFPVDDSRDSFLLGRGCLVYRGGRFPRTARHAVIRASRRESVEIRNERWCAIHCQFTKWKTKRATLATRLNWLARPPAFRDHPKAPRLAAGNCRAFTNLFTILRCFVSCREQRLDVDCGLCIAHSPFCWIERYQNWVNFEMKRNIFISKYHFFFKFHSMFKLRINIYLRLNST